MPRAALSQEGAGIKLSCRCQARLVLMYKKNGVVDALKENHYGGSFLRFNIKDKISAPLQGRVTLRRKYKAFSENWSTLKNQELF